MALAALAVAQVGKNDGDKELRRKWLVRACDSFERAAALELSTMWEIHGSERWRTCATELDRLEPEGKRMRSWQAAATRIRKAQLRYQ
jgi:hypothetical protein